MPRRVVLPSSASATSGSWPTSTRARPRRPSASSTTPGAPTRWARCTRALQLWTGWRRSRSAASRSRLLPRRRPGAIFASTSSIRPGTWTLRSRWSAACACSTARSPSSTPSRAWSRSPRPSGAVQSMVDRLGARPVPIQLPVGQEEHFRGIVDLVEMRAVTWADDLGTKMDTGEIPTELLEQAQEYHHQLIDAVADHDDELMETYLLDEDSVTPEMLKRALRAATLDISVTPVLAGSAFKNKGVQPLLDAVVDYLPSPLDVPPVHGIDPRTEHELSRRPANDEPFSALVFKVMSDPYVGKLTYFRVYSGQVKAGDRVMNTTTGKTERIGRILQMHANHREEREDIGAGEIAAIVGFKATTTGDTVSVETSPIRLESMTFPEPVISVAIEPKTKGDQDKLGIALQRLAEEDPTFRVRTDEETGQTIIAGMGELHLEVLVDRMLREFKVEANVGRPQVAYRETIGKRVDNVEGR